MAATKEQHYIHQLALALTAGQWTVASPAHTPNGTQLSWADLFRKFKKHSPTNKHRVFIAEQTYLLGVMLAYSDEKERLGDYDFMNCLGYPVDLGNEGLLGEERRRKGESRKIYTHLKKMEQDRDELSDIIYYALAYYAYALSKPEECLLYLEMIPQYSILRDLLGDDIEVSSLPGPSGSPPPTMLGIPDSGTSASASSSSLLSFRVTSSAEDFKRDMKMWSLTEYIRAVCLKGMATERFNPASPYLALQIYSSAYPLLNLFNTLLSPSPDSQQPPKRSYYSYSSAQTANTTSATAGSSTPMFSGFGTVEETHRWVDRLLWRWTICAARTCHVGIGPYIVITATTPTPSTPNNTISTSSSSRDEKDESLPNLDSLWTPLLLSSTLSSYCPPTFRSAHRVLICVIAFRSWILRKTSIMSTSTSPTASSEIQELQVPHSLHPRTVLPVYRTLLTSCTTFPRAGKKNWVVEDCVGLAVQCHSLGTDGLSLSGVLDILWWATTLTFNAPIVYRNMSRLLYMNGDFSLARRTVGVYEQVVGKAWQTRTASSSSSSTNNGDESGSTVLGVVEVDTHERWVETLVFGARMLARQAGALPLDSAHIGVITRDKSAPASEEHAMNALQMLTTAKSCLHKCKERLGLFVATKQEDDEAMNLKAEVSLAEGIVEGVLGIRAFDTQRREIHLRSSHTHLLTAIEQSPKPTSSMWYHLCISWIRIHSLRANDVKKFGVPRRSSSSWAKEPNGYATSYENEKVAEDEDEDETPLEKALEAAGQALEDGQMEVRNWHLLGIVLGMLERWSDAKDILERGCRIGDVDDEDDDSDVEGEGEAEEDGTGKKGGIDGLPNGGIQEEEEHPLLTPVKMFVLPPTSSTLPAEDDSELEAEPESPTTPNQQNPHPFHFKTTTKALPVLPSCPYTIEESFFPRTQVDRFEYSLQIRMTLGMVVEKMEGAEGAVEYWVGVYKWVAEAKGSGWAAKRTSTAFSHPGTGTTTPHLMEKGNSSAISISIDQHDDPAPAPLPNGKKNSAPSTPTIDAQLANSNNNTNNNNLGGDSFDINVMPPTPNGGAQSPSEPRDSTSTSNSGSGYGYGSRLPAPGGHMSASDVRDQFGEQVDKLGQTGKKVQQMLKHRVHQGTVRISTMTKKVGVGLKRSNSTPDFHSALKPMSYQASSIHSRRRRLSLRRRDTQDTTVTGVDATSLLSTAENAVPPLPPPPPPPAAVTSELDEKADEHVGEPLETRWKERKKKRQGRMLSDLWLMSAACFRRLGKIDECKGAIQEAEVRDEGNPGVWVQLGLYYQALGRTGLAIDALQKALFICPDDVPASIHLCRLWLTPIPILATATTSPSSTAPSSMIPQEHSDLAAGMLEHLTRGPGWDVPEAWYFLAKAYGLQERKDRERECLGVALKLSEGRGVRDVGVAVGCCL